MNVILNESTLAVYINLLQLNTAAEDWAYPQNNIMATPLTKSILSKNGNIIGPGAQPRFQSWGSNFLV